MKLGVCVLLAVLAVAGCGGTPTAPSFPSPAPVTPPSSSQYDGTWTGETSQMQAVRFTVVGTEVKSLEFNFTYTGSEPACSVQGGFGGGGSFGTIANGVFSIFNPFVVAPGSFTWSVIGSFTSTDSAIGKLEISFSPRPPGGMDGCGTPVAATWSAQKTR